MKKTLNKKSTKYQSESKKLLKKFNKKDQLLYINQDKKNCQKNQIKRLIIEHQSKLRELYKKIERD